MYHIYQVVFEHKFVHNQYYQLRQNILWNDHYLYNNNPAVTARMEEVVEAMVVEMVLYLADMAAMMVVMDTHMGKTVHG